MAYHRDHLNFFVVETPNCVEHVGETQHYLFTFKNSVNYEAPESEEKCFSVGSSHPRVQSHE